MDRDDTVPDCRACHIPENRAAWGCDAPRPDPVWQIACECGGVQLDCARDDCEEGWRPLYRCPRALIRERGGELGIGRFLHSWSAWREHGVLPGPGAFLDQPASWVQAVYVADAERAAWDRERDEWMRSQRKKVGAGGRT